MLCPYCHKDNNKVYVSSPPWYHDRTSIKRYRKCKSCGASFSTVERYAEDNNDERSRWMDPWQMFSLLCQTVVENENVRLDVTMMKGAIHFSLEPFQMYEGKEEEDEEDE